MKPNESSSAYEAILFDSAGSVGLRKFYSWVYSTDGKVLVEGYSMAKQAEAMLKRRPESFWLDLH